MKSHLKRLDAPKSWVIPRKEHTFITRPSAGAHSMDLGMPLAVVLKDFIKAANTTREVKRALGIKHVVVDGKRVRDHKRIVGLLDIISLPENKENYRMTLGEDGTLMIKKIDAKEANHKLAKVIGKTMVKKGKLQVNLSDGRNILVGKDDVATGDSLVIEVPSQKVIEHLKCQAGAQILIIGGKRKGEQGKIVDIIKDEVLYQSKTGKFTTLKDYALVVGKDKPVVTL